MNKILITGIDGFVGNYFAKFLLKSNKDKIFGTGLSFVNSAAYKDLSRLTTTGTVDLTNKQDTYDFLKSCKPDLIIHLAAQSSIPISWENPFRTININMMSTYNLLESICELNLMPKKVLVISAAAAYGHVKKNGELITEKDEFSPDNPYAVSKVGSEMIANQFMVKHKLNINIARPFTHIGPGQSDKFVCSEFAKTISLIEKGSIKNNLSVGNLEIRRDFLDVRDVVFAYDLIINKSKPGEIFNVCSGRGTSIKSILDSLLGQSNKNINIEIDRSKFRENEAKCIVGDNSKIVNMLKWNPRFNINQSLLDILNYWREN
ncbi:MAG: GDP-6-deoxy-D-mannose reductase [Alphaproteobacteria bacterium MarineAlpha5_Bin11]|nr:GDP-mannose 4,6 dehydratase [Pelagibacteraceae bacterium]PPR43979.1 MAG: GDP-6-deoxy-D-mannose reductase [Alphaproteobacteria bacterium MarineAlpha5_Bin11]PPR51270.1 MAG: GDP-6-deoxy-D-mannose reductase [Alphaproteobacteria bacterium MarineAlpha5_Bin10]|tara:strand:+ start:14143 stop:15099 length:957 start_codon:yes stop_codon:yes gene_type:complete